MVGLRDLAAELIVAGDKVLHELVQAGLENQLNITLHQPIAGCFSCCLAVLAGAVENAEILQRVRQLIQ